jgi:hypothetical protein
VRDLRAERGDAEIPQQRRRKRGWYFVDSRPSRLCTQKAGFNGIFGQVLVLHKMGI